MRVFLILIAVGAGFCIIMDRICVHRLFQWHEEYDNNSEEESEDSP